MTHNAYFEQVKLGAGGAWFFYGEEEYVKAQAILALRASVLDGSFDEFNLTQFEGNAPCRAICEACGTLPMIAEKRLVIVNDWALLLPGRVKDDADTDALKAIIESPIDTCVLVFAVHGMPDGRRAMTQFLQKHAQCVECARLNDMELNKWIVREFKREGAQIDNETAQVLSFSAGRDLNTLKNEIRKIASYAGEKIVLRQDIEAIATRTLESSVFVMIDHLLSGGKTALAYAEAQALTERGESPMMILAMLERQARLMYFARAMKEKGMPLAEMRAQLEITGFVQNKLMPLINQYPLITLETWWRTLTDYDYAVKSGRMSDVAALSMGMNLLI